MTSDADAPRRIERDSLGDVEVDAERYWGAQTERSRGFFAIGREVLPPDFIRAYVMLKRVAAEVNARLGELDAEVASAIVDAAREIETGAYDDQFPLRVWQTGSGTQTNMNVNEVIAGRANEVATGTRGGKSPVHPNDHVNRGQSSNDTFPTAMHVATAVALRDRLIPTIDRLLATLDAKAATYRDLVKIGRTHLQDATPLTLGQEIGGWAAQVRSAKAMLEAAAQPLEELAIGGTAVGTGVNAHPRFGSEVAAGLAAETGLAFASAPDKFAALAGHEAMASVSAALGTLAGALFKIANDVRWLASGPRCGLAEIRIPANEPGSSIMPGKVNPTQSEALMMVCLQVFGNHTTVQMAASQGSFELNVCKPVILFSVLQSIELLADAATSFEAHCVRGLEPDRERIAALLDRSLMLVTGLAPHIGYDAAARIARKAHLEGTSLREAALALGAVSEADFDRWTDPDGMLGP